MFGLKNGKDNTFVSKEEKDKQLVLMETFLTTLVKNSPSVRFLVTDVEEFSNRGLAVKTLEDSDFQILMEKIGIVSFTLFATGDAVSFKLNPESVRAARLL